METKLEAHLGYWLRRVSNHVSGAFAKSLEQKDASVAEWVVLSRIGVQPGITPGELANALELTRGAVSKILDKLEVKGWVKRGKKADDSRVQLLTLTRAGSKILPQMAAIADENDRKFFSVLDASESEMLRGLLTKLSALHGLKSVPME